jgi:hypothetical protein
VKQTKAEIQIAERSRRLQKILREKGEVAYYEALGLRSIYSHDGKTGLRELVPIRSKKVKRK